MRPLECVCRLTLHNLLRDVVPRWSSRILHKQPPPLIAGAWHNDTDSDVEEFDSDDLSQGIPKLLDGGNDWDAWNTRHRVSTKVLAAASPGHSLLTGLIVSAPQVRLLHRVEHVSADRYMTEVFDGWLKGDNPDDGPLCRILYAASCKSTNIHFGEVTSLLWQSEAYGVLPARARNQAQSTLAYSCLSRAAGHSLMNTHMRKKGYHTNLFRLAALGNEEALRDIMNDPECLWDNFARQFFATYNSARLLRSMECRLVLLCAALMLASIVFTDMVCGL